MIPPGGRDARPPVVSRPDDLPSRIRDAGCVGVVLAGGGARRLGGAAKGLLHVRGERILDRVALALREASDAVVIAANDPDAATWVDADAVITDLHSGAGPLAGLHAALATLNRPVLLVAWDMPFVSPGLLHELRRRGESTPGAAAVVPESAEGALEPLCAWYAPSCAPVLDRALAAGARRVRDVVASLPGLRTLRVEDVRRFGNPDAILASVNTPEELARARGEAGG